MKFINNGETRTEEVILALKWMKGTFSYQDKISEILDRVYCIENNDGVLIVHHTGTIHKYYLQLIWEMLGEEYNKVQTIKYVKEA